MSIATATLATLEFPRIREQLARYTAFTGSRELALNLTPDTDPQRVAWRLRLTREARRLLAEYPDATIGGIRDIRPAVQIAGRGGMLDGATLLLVLNTLRALRLLRRLMLRLSPETYQILPEIGAALVELPALEETLGRSIGDDGSILDSASAALSRIRADIRTYTNRLQERMHSYITSSTYTTVLQEPIVTVRNGRYVLPVKAAHRRSLPGLVHDQSASGATLYIEPLAVVDLNNDLREAQMAEEHEIKRILAALSDQVGREAEMLITAIEAVALIDLALAQAKYADALRAVEPTLTDLTAPPTEPTLSSAATATATDRLTTAGRDTAPLLLTAARHPLLDPTQVVPIDLWLGDPFRLLLITGPNTGGKTVALKTVGLLALMAQSGLHVPATEPVRLPVLQAIFADIGDEQSIEQSLSTFSAHMTNIIRILGELDHLAQHTAYAGAILPALVLLDELGAGTDPVEGAALARAIATRLLEHGCLAIATSHYAELKAFAHNTPGVQNASVEFDLETLSPTYQLTIGLPGRSNALAIAARLGLEPELVELARSMLVQEAARVEDLLADIRAEREALVQDRERAAALREDAEKYRDRLATALHEFEDARQARLDELERQIEQELREMQQHLRRQRGDSRSSELARQWAAQAEQYAQAMQQRVQATGTAPDAANQLAQLSPTGEQLPRPLQIGDSVLVRSVGLVGEILAIDPEEQEADVQMGGFRMRVGLNELRRDTGKTPSARRRPPPEPVSISIPAMPEVSMSFDMRGWRVADVQEQLERYLSDAYRAGLPSVRLIHGKGTGALRQVVREIVQRHPLVQAYASGGADGGDGVTIATLAER